MANFAGHSLKSFQGTLWFAFLASAPVTFGGWAVIIVFAAMGTPYAFLSVFSVFLLTFATRRIVDKRNLEFPLERRKIHEASWVQMSLYTSATVGGLNALSALLLGAGGAGLANIGYAMVTPYWWFEIPFFQVIAALDLGSGYYGSAMDSLLFLSAHKALAAKLLGGFWLPLVVAGYFLPPQPAFIVFSAVGLWGPALAFACWMHPGDSEGTPRRARNREALA